MKTYSRHYCGATHQTYRELAQCMFRPGPHPARVCGEGGYAMLSTCQGPTVTLYETLDQAQAELDLARGACGARGGWWHDLLRIVSPSLARPLIVKTYSRHNCAATHRTYRALAECIFHDQRPWWVAGTGEYATLSHCRGLTITLHKTIKEALTALALIDSDACGGNCHNAHQLVRIVKPSLARPRRRGPARATQDLSAATVPRGTALLLQEMEPEQ
jgi:hypothetical protein